jgi:hypothetical protein
MSFQTDEPPQTVEWYTPPNIFNMLGCSFYLDPCHPGRDVIDWGESLTLIARSYTPPISSEMVRLRLKALEKENTL